MGQDVRVYRQLVAQDVSRIMPAQVEVAARRRPVSLPSVQGCTHMLLVWLAACLCCVMLIGVAASVVASIVQESWVPLSVYVTLSSSFPG